MQHADERRREGRHLPGGLDTPLPPCTLWLQVHSGEGRCRCCQVLMTWPDSLSSAVSGSLVGCQ